MYKFVYLVVWYYWLARYIKIRDSFADINQDRNIIQGALKYTLKYFFKIKDKMLFDFSFQYTPIKNNIILEKKWNKSMCHDNNICPYLPYRVFLPVQFQKLSHLIWNQNFKYPLCISTLFVDKKFANN